MSCQCPFWYLSSCLRAHFNPHSPKDGTIATGMTQTLHKKNRSGAQGGTKLIDKKGTPLKYFLCNGACVGCECRPFHISCRRMIGWPSKAQSSVRTFQLSHLHIYWTCVGLIQAFKTGRSFSIYSEYFPVERLCVQHTRVYRYTVATFLLNQISNILYSDNQK